MSLMATSPWTGQVFLYWMRLWHSLWSWFSDTSPPPLLATVYALTGMETKLSWRKPFQVERAAIAGDQYRHGFAKCTPARQGQSVSSITARKWHGCKHC